MPTSIAAAIARQLEADPAETDRVLEDLVQNVRHDVARDGESVVPGLGTFRLFNGTIVFEPDYGLALSVNHRYAGLEPLLVNGSERRRQEEHAPASYAGAVSPGTLPETGPEPDDLSVPSLSIHPEEEVPGQAAPPAEPFQDTEELEREGAAGDTEPFAEEDTDVPPPEDTELVAMAVEPPFEPEISEPEVSEPEYVALPEETEAEPPAAEQPALAAPEDVAEQEEALDEREPADAVPDVLGEFASSRPTVPAIHEEEPEGTDEAEIDEEEEAAWDASFDETGEETLIWAGPEALEEPEAPREPEIRDEEEAPETPQDREMPAEQEAGEAREELRVQEDEAYPEPPALGAQLTSGSPFFEPWPEDLPSLEAEPNAQIFPSNYEEPPAETEPAEAASEELPSVAPEPDDFETWNPEQPEPEPSAEISPYGRYEPEPPVQEPAPEAEVEETSPEPPAPVLEAAETYPADPLTAASAEASEPETPEPEAEERKRSIAGWLIGAVVLIAILAALYLLFIPRQRPVPPATPPVAENTAPAPSTTDTSSASAVMDTAGAAVNQPEPAPPAASPAEEVPSQAETGAPTPSTANISPLRRPGGIDVSAGGVTLVVASTPSRTSADAMARRFRDMGYTTATFYGDYGGVTRYRVGVGQFKDDVSAEAQRDHLPDAFPDDTWLMPIRSDMEIYQ
ncbi:MAG TPA: SPOR domain-containing protein [Rhodothermales bacterium]|nr:SPOR domain-containing protein [Rhodothermales bacterium]